MWPSRMPRQTHRKPRDSFRASGAPTQRAGRRATGESPKGVVSHLILTTEVRATTPTGRRGYRAPSIANKARTARAVARAADPPIITELQAAGVTTLRASQTS
jgi:hypothetical protein